MRLVCISDTHGAHNKLNGVFAPPNGDVLVHTGDFTHFGSLEEAKSFGDWINKQPHKYKIIVAGNHDSCFERPNEAHIAQLCLGNAIYLQDSGCTIDGIKFWGSPWVSNGPTRTGSFIKPPEDLFAPPDDVDVLLTHTGNAPCLFFQEEGKRTHLPVVSGEHPVDFLTLFLAERKRESEERRRRCSQIALHVYGHSYLSTSPLDCKCIYASLLDRHSNEFAEVQRFPTVVDLVNREAKIVRMPIEDRYDGYLESRRVARCRRYRDTIRNEFFWLDGVVERRLDDHFVARITNFTWPELPTQRRQVRAALVKNNEKAKVRRGATFVLRVYKTTSDDYEFDLSFSDPALTRNGRQQLSSKLMAAIDLL